MLKAICENDIDIIEDCLQKGWDVNAPIDTAGKFNAVSLACHIDNLEVLHCLDMYGADLESGVGKFNQTPMMCATIKWNVRIIDYLMERKVDPSIKDSFGFTAT